MDKPTLVVWHPKYSVGNTFLDFQHRRMFRTINELHAATPRVLSVDELERTLCMMFDYAENHFKDEEELMRKASYPGLAAHERAHRAFVQKAKGLFRDLQRRGPESAEDILGFLKQWLRDHITDMDKQYAPYVAKSKRHQ